MKRRLARWIDAFGEALVWIAARCFEAAYTLNPELLDANHTRLTSEQVVANVLERIASEDRIASEERPSLCQEAVQMADTLNQTVYMVPKAALRQWIN